MIIEVPDWCVIGKIIEWNAPHITGYEWVRDEIISFGYDGFFIKSIIVLYIIQSFRSMEKQ